MTSFFLIMYTRFFIFFILFIAHYSFAQYCVSGTVTNRNNEPLAMVTVHTSNYLKWTTTNEKGYFEFETITQPIITLIFNRLGLKEKKITIDFSTNKTQNISLQLHEDNLALDEVIVTGSLKNNRKTSTIIKQKAIAHLQATSLADVLQLVPGQLIQNQNFDDVKQVLIRQKDTRDGAEDATSFGTNIRINGISQSNNANLQNASSALRGNINYFNSTAGRGNDLRSIATNNIEKIEVIKGIPSVAYGDITSGVILIETKKGKSPLEITQRITPKVYQTAVNKGFSFKNKSTLNVDFDYTKALQSEREKALNYTKLRGNLVYVSPLFSNAIKSTTSFSAETIFDGNNDDNATTQRKNKQNGFQFAFTGEWYANKKWMEKLTFNVATSYQEQKSLDKQIVNKPLSVLSLFTNTNEGAGIFLPQTYISEVNVNGKPFSFYSKITNEFTKKAGNTSHQFLVGLEYNYEKNFGNGVRFNPQRPPEGLGFQTLRERPYKNVPALNQLSFFAEDVIKFPIYSIQNEIALGVRIDNFQPNNILTSKYGLQVSPRINFSSKINSNFIVKGGWGIATKSPSLLYLYPDNAFFDLVSLNHFTGNANENLVLLSTHVFNTENTNINVAKSNKFEFGFNYTFGKNNIDLTLYKEQTNNAFGYAQKAVFMPYNVYEVTQTNPNQLPNYSLLETRNFIGTYNTPSNHFTIKNKGIELLTDIKISNPFSLQLSGGYITTDAIYTNDDFKIETNAVTGNQLIATYKNGGTNTNEQLNTTLRSILHIPEIKFIISLTTQTIWFEKQQQKNYSNTPYQYANANGIFIPFDINNSTLVQQFTRNANNSTTNKQPIWLFNCNITKEVGNFGKLSFFVNNMFNSRPILNNRLRNIPFFYGFEASIKL